MAIGLLLLIAGVVGGVVLWLVAEREPDRVADAFARAAPGCRTTLSFAETGEFYVFEEQSGLVMAEGCEPSVDPDQPFEFVIVDSDGTRVGAVEDRSVTYDLDVGSATSVARVTIDRPGGYEIEVRGNDVSTVAAIGGDPNENVGRIRSAAVAAAIIGVMAGGLLLWLARRRSSDGAADGPQQGDWPPKPPSIEGLPIGSTSPWAPPSVGDAPSSFPPLPAPTTAAPEHPADDG